MPENETAGLPSITTVFWIQGDELDPNLCTEEVGIPPTDSGTKGQLRPGKRPPVPHSYWEVALRREPRLSTEDGLVKLLDLLWPVREKIRRFVHERPVAAGFGSWVTIRHDLPQYRLSLPTLSRLTFFNVKYDMDINRYDWMSHVPDIQSTAACTVDSLPVAATGLSIEGETLDAERLVLSLALPKTIEVKLAGRSRRSVPAVVIELGKRRPFTIDQCVSELLDILWPHRELISRALAEAAATGALMLSVWIHKERPVYSLSADSLQRLAELGVAYQLEVYDSRE
jgi:hypothetical protein